MQRPGASSRNVMIVLEEFQGIGVRTQGAAPPNVGRAHWGVLAARRALKGGGDAGMYGRVAPAPFVRLLAMSALTDVDSEFPVTCNTLASPQARAAA